MIPSKVFYGRKRYKVLQYSNILLLILNFIYIGLAQDNTAIRALLGKTLLDSFFEKLIDKKFAIYESKYFIIPSILSLALGLLFLYEYRMSLYYRQKALDTLKQSNHKLAALELKDAINQTKAEKESQWEDIISGQSLISKFLKGCVIATLFMFSTFLRLIYVLIEFKKICKNERMGEEFKASYDRFTNFDSIFTLLTGGIVATVGIIGAFNSNLLDWIKDRSKFDSKVATAMASIFIILLFLRVINATIWLVSGSILCTKYYLAPKAKFHFMQIRAMLSSDYRINSYSTDLKSLQNTLEVLLNELKDHRYISYWLCCYDLDKLPNENLELNLDMEAQITEIPTCIPGGTVDVTKKTTEVTHEFDKAKRGTQPLLMNLIMSLQNFVEKEKCSRKAL